MVAFQRIGPRRRPGTRKLWRDATDHLRAFYGPPGESRRRHHLAAIALPAAPEQASEFFKRCTDRLVQRGARPDELPVLLGRIESRLLRENLEQMHAETAASDVREHLLLAARALARVKGRRRS